MRRDQGMSGNGWLLAEPAMTNAVMWSQAENDAHSAETPSYAPHAVALASLARFTTNQNEKIVALMNKAQSDTNRLVSCLFGIPAGTLSFRSPTIKLRSSAPGIAR